jgi:hypothetical protein
MRKINTTNANKRWRELRKERIAEYNTHPRICENCPNPIPYDVHTCQRFCSRSCAALYNNALRPHKHQSHDCKLCGKSLSYKTVGDHCIKCASIVDIESRISNGEKVSIQALRRYLIKIRGKKCEECKLETWRDIPIPLDTHHINGKCDDDRIENLKLLCPNCHSITPTYKGKNKGNGRSNRRYR